MDDRGASVPPTAEQRQWLEKNLSAIKAYNERVAEHGLLSDHAGLIGCGIEPEGRLG